MKRILTLIAVVCTLVWAAGCVETEDQNGNRENEGAQTEQKEWAIAIHGGAGAISPDRPDSVKQAYMDDLNEALTMGEEALQNGESAVDVVEKVINYFEDNPRFNAGKGAVFTSEGGHELDAAIMIGNTREAGAITGVTTVKNPISLARLVMENSRHVMFAGQGAEEYASEMDVERVNQDYFHTQSRHEAWKRAVEREEEQQSSLVPGENTEAWNQKYGTVGCVVLDQEGTLVAGTSTGGMTNKKYGRVGDVPIIGAGTYASDVVAVSMTGWGEKIMRAVSGHTVSSYMKFSDASLDEAGDYLLNDVLEPGDAGMIAVDKYGNTYTNMNTQGMYQASSNAAGQRDVSIWKEE